MGRHESKSRDFKERAWSKSSGAGTRYGAARHFAIANYTVIWDCAVHEKHQQSSQGRDGFARGDYPAATRVPGANGARPDQQDCTAPGPL